MSFFRADNCAASLKGNMHPFMQIKCDGVSSFDSQKFWLYRLCQYSDRADGSIHMEPEIFTLAEIRQRVQVLCG